MVIDDKDTRKFLAAILTFSDNAYTVKISETFVKLAIDSSNDNDESRIIVDQDNEDKTEGNAKSKNLASTR